MVRKPNAHSQIIFRNHFSFIKLSIAEIKVKKDYVMSKLQNILKTSMPFSALAIVFLFLAIFQKDNIYLTLGLVWVVIAFVKLLKNHKKRL